MKRALQAAAAFLALLAALTPPPTSTTTQTAAEAVQWRPTEQQVTRHSRPTETTPQTITVRAGDTYGRLAVTYCGTFTAWHALKAANGWLERAIPVGATLTIACQQQPTPTRTEPTRQPTPAPARIQSATPWVHPLASGKLGNSCYRTSARPGHNGVDMAQPAGTVIRAASAGTVHRKAYQAGGAGHYIVVKHAASIYTAYMHFRSPSPLNVGATVAAGQTIGFVGATGNATGNHLHFEVHQGYDHPINPAPFMRARGINIGC